MAYKNNSFAYKSEEEIEEIKKRRVSIASGQLHIEAEDLDNMGYTLVDYCRNPNIELKLKVLFYVVDWGKDNPGKSLFMRYKTIAKNLNEIGVYRYYDALDVTDPTTFQIIEKKMPRPSSIRTKKSKLNRRLVFDYCTVEGIISSFKDLRDMNLINFNYAAGKKSEAENPNEYIFRTITVNYKELSKYFSIYSEEVAHAMFKPKSRQRKLYDKCFVTCKAFIESEYKKLSEALKRRYKTASDMFYTRIYKFSKKYFSNKKNAYLSKTPDSQIQMMDKLDAEAYKWFKTHRADVKVKDRPDIIPGAKPTPKWVDDYILNIADGLETV